MSRFSMFLALLAVLAFGLGLSGCGDPEDTSSEQEAGAGQNPGHGEPGHVHAEGEAGHDHDDGHEEGHDEDPSHDDDLDHGEHDHAEGDADHSHDGAQLDSDIAEALALLSESERAAAEKQRTCPVGDELLGSMGKPCKVTVKGQDVFLCCQGCEGAIMDDPDKYLAKLNK